MWLRSIAWILALSAPVAAHAEWLEASTDHFVVYADEKPETISRFATELEKFDKAMRVSHPNARKPIAGPANRVKVFVMSTSRMEKLTGSDFTRGFYIPRAGGNVAFVPRLSGSTEKFDLNGPTVLRHEYAHHFMYSSMPAIFPIWFSEGFAEYWSTTSIEKDGGALIGRSPAHRGWGLMNGNPLPVDQLLTLTNRKLTREQQEAIYGRGWLLTHYLMSDAARQKQLGQYIGALNQGEPLDKAAKAFGDLKQLGKELEQYLRRPKLPASRVAATSLVTTPVALRKLTAGEIATMPVRIESRAGVSPEEARKIVIDARKAAAPYPNDPGAQVALAEAEYDADNHALADAAASRAIAADPKHSDALVYRAMSRFALAEAGTDNAAWAGVRRAIVAANRLDPEDPRPLILYYRSFMAAGETPPDAARAGFAKAYDIAPSDLGLRMNAATMFLNDGDKAEAREALRLVAFHPHGGSMAEHARSMVAAIDRGDPVKTILAARPASDTETPAKDAPPTQ